ncbi:diuretic hormone class 2 isoform X1 [Trichogramma pretiosum]|uniref:Diuretic hormone 31 n=1 Tax=Trichogramma kaykai TaxID=54128 RepID=A0ABD2X476_9HYME|nr:diuretic hormone class 2 isoform X1 [Trichogramma pretiosum]XP_014226774.1 diuretic hormone class 2 isoform X1 [Trichogramma pretiosum]
MQHKIVLCCLVLLVATALTVQALPYTRARLMWNQFQEDFPEAAQELEDRIENMALFVQDNNDYYDEFNNKRYVSAKRGLDLGLNRGFSGSQAAKHLMGLAAANYAGGPGRRRRSEQASRAASVAAQVVVPGNEQV